MGAQKGVMGAHTFSVSLRIFSIRISSSPSFQTNPFLTNLRTRPQQPVYRTGGETGDWHGCCTREEEEERKDNAAMDMMGDDIRGKVLNEQA